LTPPPCGENRLLSALRSRTADAHRRLEEAVEIEQRIRQADDYRDLLARFWGFYAPLEQALAAVAWRVDPVPDWIRPKTPALRRDLQELGIADPATLPVCRDLPKLGDWRAALGCHYVLEGATLGGRTIVKLMAREDRTSDLPAGFFSGYGEATGEHWRRFCACLHRHSLCEAALLSAPAAAEATFASMERWLGTCRSARNWVCR